ncbi:glycosyl transferase, group 1 family [Aliivibrio fischeri MJ11]|uniref:Glycosyl transferase, group 1 family n=1 Tax=Aliivibrio fischeri (strain MJ11) TaxID=388396 RepID=B5FFV1_ALIFM|nr:glycosyltransferase [Aliivibrio fischeri]ACH65117.1 glycosyl transferase, group 1 family [Aliivibrio fischeri MJ11]
MKKIILVSNYSGLYGSELMLEKLYLSLKDDYEVKTYLNEAIPVPEEFSSSINAVTNRFNVVSKNNKRISLSSLMFWLKVFVKDKPDLVIVNISLIPEVFLATKALRIKSMVFVRESLIDYKHFFGIYERYLKLFCDCVVSNSRYTSSMFSKLDSMVISDCIDLPEKSIKIRLGVVPKFGYLGRMSLRKGVITLLSALNDSVNRPFELHLIGDKLSSDALFDEQYEELIRRLRLKGNLIIEHGFLSNPFEIVEKCDFMVAPSILPETFGLSVLECLSVGVPVIASNIGAYPELVSKNNGFTFFPNDSVDLGAKLNIALSYEGDDYASLSENAIFSAESYGFLVYRNNILRLVKNV